jgi:iduronate 2-sulfatase
MFERRDSDKDGHLSREEFLVNQSDPDKAPGRFTRMDKDKNGKLSRQEFVENGSQK